MYANAWSMQVLAGFRNRFYYVPKMSHSHSSNWRRKNGAQHCIAEHVIYSLQRLRDFGLWDFGFFGLRDFGLWDFGLWDFGLWDFGSALGACDGLSLTLEGTAAFASCWEDFGSALGVCDGVTQAVTLEGAAAGTSK